MANEQQLSDIIPKEEFEKFDRLKEILVQLQVFDDELRANHNMELHIKDIKNV